MDMKKAVLTVLALGFASTSFAQENSAAPSAADLNCDDFSTVLSTEVTSGAENIASTLTELLTSCPAVADQIVETVISLTPAEQHQDLMQFAADTGLMQPADVLLAAIAGGGDPVTLSEPTAAGNLSIVAPSSATTPPIIGGRNGGSPEADTASNN